MASQPVTDRLGNTEIHSYVRGYHEYKHIWDPIVGKTLRLERQPNNHKDRCAVAVKKDNVTVGHIPYNLAPTISAFLSRGVNAGFVEVTGPKINRGGGYGLEIPCIYRFYGSQLYVDRLQGLAGEGCI